MARLRIAFLSFGSLVVARLHESPGLPPSHPLTYTASNGWKLIPANNFYISTGSKVVYIPPFSKFLTPFSLSSPNGIPVNDKANAYVAFDADPDTLTDLTAAINNYNSFLSLSDNYISNVSIVEPAQTDRMPLPKVKPSLTFAGWRDSTDKALAGWRKRLTF